MKYWEIIADNLSKAGFSWGCVSAIDSNGRTFFAAFVFATSSNPIHLVLRPGRWKVCVVKSLFAVSVLASAGLTAMSNKGT